MTEYTVDSWDEMQGIKAEAGDVVIMRGKNYIAIRQPESIDGLEMTIPHEPKPKRKMSYPSQAIYKPRKK